jgi:DNA-binding response OmpR family regulator
MSAAVSARSRIFVVDDDVCLADMVSLILHEAGFQVSTFYDALSAAQYALEYQPDAVITDYSMPHMNGLEFAAWLQEHCPDCEIVILSGDATLDAKIREAEMDFTLLQKPAHPDALIAAVRRASRRV